MNLTISGHVAVDGNLYTPRVGVGTCTAFNVDALTEIGGAATVAGSGSTGAFPRWKHNIAGTWTYGPWQATLNQLFINSYRDAACSDGTFCRDVGTYSVWGINGQYTGFNGIQGRRHGGLHFAGEHTSVNYQGYMEGALRSGYRCAAEITGG